MRYEIGGRIREVRERRGRSLKETAQEAQISSSLLSQIERNKVSPSLETLLTIAEVLGLDLDYLFQDYKQKGRIRLIKERERNNRNQDGITYEEICPVISRESQEEFEAVMLTIPPGKVKGNSEYGHPGSEQGVVLEGSAELEYGDKNYTLRPGDGVAFQSDLPHTLKNTGKETFRAIWILQPRRVFGTREE